MRVAGLRDTLNHSVAFDKEPAQIASQHQCFRDPAERSERSCEYEFITHLCFVVSGCDEEVVMLEALEHALDHHVLKVMWLAVLRDERLVCQHEAEVTAAPGDGFAGADQAVCDAGNCLLACGRGAFDVQIDAKGQEKAAFDGRCNLCFKRDALHPNPM